jgi:hypothetical protein
MEDDTMPTTEITTTDVTVAQLATQVNKLYPGLTIDAVRLRLIRAIESGAITARRVPRSPFSKRMFYSISAEEAERVIKLYGEWIDQAKGGNI